MSVVSTLAAGLREYCLGLSTSGSDPKSVMKGPYRRFQDRRPLALPQESRKPSRDMRVTHTILWNVLPARALVCAARRSEMPGSYWFSAEASATTIHPHIRPVGSFGSAEVTTRSASDMYDWTKSSRSPILDVSQEFNVRGGCQRINILLY